jgi:hypothetical protein
MLGLEPATHGSEWRARLLYHTRWRVDKAVLGSMDRVTGDMEATITHWLDMQRRNISNEQHYALKCKPTQRMF